MASDSADLFGTVHAGPWRRLIIGLRFALGALSAPTPGEVLLRHEVDRLNAALDASRAYSGSLETEVRFLKSEGKIQELEITSLLAVNARDRARVKSEEASFVARVNELTGPRERRPLLG